jgi:hypothetical protein
VDGVSVGEQEPFALCLTRSGENGVVLAGPTWWERSGFDYTHFTRVCRGEGLGDFARSVGRVVIDDDDFEVYALLCDQRFEARAEAGFFVARGDNYGYLNWFGGCWRRRHGSNPLL